MVELSLIQNFGVALLLGLIVGLEREFQHQKEKTKDFAGIRTFILIAVFGWIIGFLAQQEDFHALILVGLAGMILFIIASYLAVVWRGKGIGATSELSALIVFLLGILVAQGYILVPVMVAILMTTILSYKYYLHKFAQQLELEEVHAGLKLGIISLVVLPLLPNVAYSPIDIPVLKDILGLFPSVYSLLASTQVFNPFNIWLMVVFICAISTIGYILIKILGTRKGIGLTGAVGGFISSTAVTSSLSETSKRSNLTYNFSFGVIISWAIMFLRVLFVAIILNKAVFFNSLFTLGIMALVAGACAVYLYFQQTTKGKKTETAVAFKSPFALIPALKFGAFFVFILFIAKLLQTLLGSSGVYVAALLAGLADVDAITISLLTFATAGEISIPVAVTGITLAAASNTFSKCGIAYLFGKKEFAKQVGICTAIILGSGLIAVLFL
ncbi:MgtC/SapB family protein [Candidatus Woesearchaeota archaeon]|nr:MgtC/SapB family protein [Candidatus Woesearchaeota archaeon]